MKLKKLLFVVSLVATMIGFIGCDGNNNPKGPQELLDDYFFYDANGNLLDYTGCDTNVDPKKVAYIDIKFTTPMNTDDCYGFYYWGNEDINNDVYRVYWLNSRTYRMTFIGLRYGIDYKYQYCNPEAPEQYKNVIFKSKNGVVCKEFYVEFSTIKYTRKENKTFTIDFAGKEGGVGTFGDNDEYNPKTQQLLITGLHSFLDHEMLIKGDIVKIPYRIKSPNNIKNLRVNLVDNSATADYWLNLTSTTTNDIVLLKDYAGSTETNENIVEGTLEFTIDTDQLAYVALQLYDSYDSSSKTDELYTIELLPLEE